MVVITTSSLRANIYETVYDTLKAANLLSSTATVTAAYIDNDSAFPQVVIYPVKVDKEGFTYDRGFGREAIQVMIEIYTKKAKELDQLSDEVAVQMQALKMGSLQLVSVGEDIALSTDNSNKIHLKTLTYNYFRGA